MKGKLEATVKAYIDLYNATAKRAQEAAETEKAKQAAWNRLFDTTKGECLNLKARADIRKENSELLNEINAANTEKNIFSRMQKVICTSAERAAAEIVLDEMNANPEKWSKFPIHYKKFKELVNETFGKDVRIYRGNYNIQLGFDYLSPLKNIVLFYEAPERITPEAIENARKGRPGFYQPEEIEPKTREAAKERAAYIEKYEAMKKELDAIREKYTSDLQDIFPPVESLETLNYRI